jgi:glycosyltransferase involved in cell wall biosynthesis
MGVPSPGNNVTPRFTVFIDAFHGPAFLRRSAASVLEQSYRSLELIIVDNGAQPDMRKEIEQIAESDSRVRIVRFDDNQFSWEDPHIVIEQCWNAALREARGEFIFHLSYDDFVSCDYFSRMAALFDANPACKSAAGTMVGVDVDGIPMHDDPAAATRRPRFMPGHLLALDNLKGGGQFVSAGDIFTLRREDVIAAGGYHKALENSQLFGIVPFGMTGYDPQAKLYWCRHDGQLNLHLRHSGWTGFVEYTRDLVENWRIERRWHRFGIDDAKCVADTLVQKEYQSAGAQAAANLSELVLPGSWRMIWSAGTTKGYRRAFWVTFWAQLWHKRRQLFANIAIKLRLMPALTGARAIFVGRLTSTDLSKK